MSEATTPINKSPGRVFYWVERIGNKIPNPFLLFVYLIWCLCWPPRCFPGSTWR